MNEPKKPSTSISDDQSQSTSGEGEINFNIIANPATYATSITCSSPSQHRRDDDTTPTTTRRSIDYKNDNEGVFTILNNVNRTKVHLKSTATTDCVDHQEYDVENVPEKLMTSHDRNTASLYRDLAMDEAEEAVLANVEERGRRTVAAEDGFRPAVEGESPPLKVPSLGLAFVAPTASSGPPEERGRAPSPTMKSAVQKILAIQRLKGPNLMYTQSSTKNLNGERKGQHRRARTLLIDTDEARANDFAFHRGSHFLDIEKAFDDDVSGRQDASDTLYDGDRETSFAVDACVEATEDKRIPHEGQPLLNGSEEDDGKASKSDRAQYNHWLARRRALVMSPWRKFRAFLNPVSLWRRFFRWFVRSTLLVALPLFITALILFYIFDNPKPPSFFPGSATLSWWCNFVGE